VGEQDFQHEVLSRLASIETHGQYYAEGLKEIREHSERITAVEQSAKSAHHRIDGIYCAAGAIGGIAGWLVDKLATLWSGKGGG
jgi:uncharacterized protein with GYD domain